MAAERTRADLEQMVDDLNRNHFGGKVRVDSIDWMPHADDVQGSSAQEERDSTGISYTYKGKAGLCSSQGFRLGTNAEYRKNVITITNIYRDRVIPDEVVKSTVGHEMIHALLPIGDGHSARFYEMERALPTFQAGNAWNDNNAIIIHRLIAEMHRGAYRNVAPQPSIWAKSRSQAALAPVAKSRTRSPSRTKTAPKRQPARAAAALVSEDSRGAPPRAPRRPQAPRKTADAGRQAKTAGRGGRALAGAVKTASEGAAVRAQRVAHFVGFGCRDNDVCSAPDCNNMCQDYMPFCVQCWKGRLDGRLRHQCWKVCLEAPSQQHPEPTPAQQAWFDAVMVHMGVGPDYVGGPYMFKHVPKRHESGTVRAVWCLACWAPYVWGRPELTRCNTRPGPIIRASQDALTKEREMETINISDLNNPKSYQNVKEIAKEYAGGNIDRMCAEMARRGADR